MFSLNLLCADAAKKLLKRIIRLGEPPANLRDVLTHSQKGVFVDFELLMRHAANKS